MMRGAIVLLAALPLAAQINPAQINPAQDEQNALNRALAETGNTPVEVVRAFEHHLQQYPESPRRDDIERALAKSAVDLNDDRRLIEYGRRILDRDPDNLQLLEPVATALLRKGEKPSAERALEYARRLEQLIKANYRNDKFLPGGGPNAAKRKDDFDRSQARVRILQARAQGLLDRRDEAIQLAEASYTIFPSVEGAREAARWLTAAGQDREALQYLARAFTIGGLHSAEQDGGRDREQMGALYRKLNGSDAGLGDFILKTYDETAEILAARRAELRSIDPNHSLKDPMQFTLSGLDGDKLPLSSLAGKVAVLDFWATWCGPCRAQHALYEEAKARFKDEPDVVFLSIDTDDDHALVRPFLDSMKWTQKVYFEDGLQVLLQVGNIPTTIIFGKRGEVASRMVGYLPDRFVDMLSERIDEALGKPLKHLSKTPAAPVPQVISQ
jgi:thiol-disulfide isomerase/thioredoxin